MNDSNWLGILGGFWLAKQFSDEDSSNLTNSLGNSQSSAKLGDYTWSDSDYVPEDEKTCARNFVHQYVTDGEHIYTKDEFCIFVNCVGVVYFEGKDERGLESYNIYPCKKVNSLEILQHGTFWGEDSLPFFQRRELDTILLNLAQNGYSLDKRRLRVIYKYDLLKVIYPETFRVLSREESYYYWKGKR